VTGDGTASIILDQATVIVNVQAQPDDLTEVLTEQEVKVADVKAAVEGAVSDAKVSIGTRSIYPYYSGYGTPVNDDVTAAVRDVDNVFVESVFTSVSDEGIDKARKDLTEQAIANAQESASEMVEPLGLEVSGIRSIEAQTGQSVSPYGNEIMYHGVKIVQPYYYQSVTGDVSVSITVEFELAEDEE